MRPVAARTSVCDVIRFRIYAMHFYDMYFLMAKSTKNHPHASICGRFGIWLLNEHERLALFARSFRAQPLPSPLLPQMDEVRSFRCAARRLILFLILFNSFAGLRRRRLRPARPTGRNFYNNSILLNLFLFQQHNKEYLSGPPPEEGAVGGGSELNMRPQAARTAARCVKILQ